MSGSEHTSKSQKKRQRKAAKKLLEKINDDKKEEHVVEARDPLSILKDQLAEAKRANNHELARQLRQDIWVLQDTTSGHSPNLSAVEVDESLKRISKNYTATKSPGAKNVETKTLETSGSPEGHSTLSPVEKKIRNLEKKLQQISSLKMKLENGEKLEQTQISKINSEEEIKKEIEEMREVLSSVSVTM